MDSLAEIDARRKIEELLLDYCESYVVILCVIGGVGPGRFFPRSFGVRIFRCGNLNLNLNLSEVPPRGVTRTDMSTRAPP